MRINIKKRVSFDFDSTLDLRVVQDYAFELIEKGYELWICTARFDNDEAFKRWGNKNWNEDLYEVAKSLNIPNERIIFCNMDLKSNVIGKDDKFLWHLDDCTIEVNNLNLDGQVPAILRAKHTHWKTQCNAILNGNSTLLWLDDFRNPYKSTNNWIEKYAPRWENRLDEVVWVKNYDEFTNWIVNNGLPFQIAFDHDLADSHYAPKEHWNDKYDAWLESQSITEKTGMDCAKWLVEYCMDYKKDLPLWVIQSANKAGAENIQGLLTSYLKNHG